MEKTAEQDHKCSLKMQQNLETCTEALLHGMQVCECKNLN